MTREQALKAALDASNTAFLDASRASNAAFADAARAYRAEIDRINKEYAQ